MTAPEAEAALVERARVERLLEARLTAWREVAAGTHYTRATEALAIVAVLEDLLAQVEAGAHHDLVREESP